MKKVAKVLSLVLILVLMVGCIAACGKKDEAAQGGTAAEGVVGDRGHLLPADPRGDFKALRVSVRAGNHQGAVREGTEEPPVHAGNDTLGLILEQGIEQVDACFVRVEQPRLDELDQPQCVLYRFSACDLGFLEQAIVNQQSVL